MEEKKSKKSKEQKIKRTKEKKTKVQNPEPLNNGQYFRPVADSVNHPDSPVIVIERYTGFRRTGLLDVWDQRNLLWFFVLRSLRGRYRPTMLGYGWIAMRPLLICSAYILVFSLMLKVTTDPIPYPLFALLGIIVFLCIATGITATSASLISNAGLMKKIYYPRLIAPLTSTMVSFLDFLAAMPLVIVLMVFYGITPGWQAILTPFFLLGIVLTTFTLGIILAARAVTVRDVMLVLPVARRVLIYTMPCVYPVTLIPEKYQAIYFLNPLAVYLQGFRWSLWNEIPPPLWSIALATTVVLLALVWGLRSFNRVERTMADVL